MFEILELSDRCVDNDVAKTVMIQISRVILYRVSWLRMQTAMTLIFTDANTF